MHYNISKNLTHHKGTIDPSSNFLLKRAKPIHSESTETHSSTFYLLHNNVVAVHTRYKSEVIPDKFAAATSEQLNLLRLKKVAL